MKLNDISHEKVWAEDNKIVEKQEVKIKALDAQISRAKKLIDSPADLCSNCENGPYPSCHEYGPICGKLRDELEKSLKSTDADGLNPNGKS
jgi:hypothetical protein